MIEAVGSRAHMLALPTKGHERMWLWARTHAQIRCVVCRSRTSKVESSGNSVRYFSFDYGALNCVQEEEVSDSRTFFAGSVRPEPLKDSRQRRRT